MTQEHKELLLKDLSARVPYGVKYMRYSWDYETDQELPVIETLDYIDKDGYISHTKVYTVEDIKPYLFPMSSMTVKQRDSYRFLTSSAHASPAGLIDFFHKNHIDYRGLISKGLAKDATNLNIY